MNKKYENRMTAAADIEFRADGDGENKQRYVEGYGVVYNREVEIWPGYFEEVREGAFADVLASGSEIKSYIDHDASRILATTKSKPALELQDNHYGLRFKAPIPPTTYGDDFVVNLERGNIRGASFTFIVPDGGDIVTRDQKGNIHRQITKAELFEIGAVCNPAYPMTTAHARSKADIMAEMEARCKAADPETRDVENLEAETLPAEDAAPLSAEHEASAAETQDSRDAPQLDMFEAAAEEERKKEINRNKLFLLKQKINLYERSAT